MSYLAITIQYDERPLYRQTTLPAIRKAEAEFFKSMDLAEHAPGESWRLQYFLIAHGRAKEVIRVASDYHPQTPDGIRAHGELIGYYRLVNENIAIIRTEMSLNQKLDYLAEWKKDEMALEHIRQNWLDWVIRGQ